MLETDGASSQYPDGGTWIPVDYQGMPLENGPYLVVLVADGRILAREKIVIQY
jgi:hypothetical protein